MQVRHKRCGFDPWVGKIPWRRTQQPTLVFLPGESHEQKSLTGCTSIGSQSQIWLKRLKTHARLSVWASPEAHWYRIHLQCRRLTGDTGLILGSRISPGVGNGNIVQYSYLENYIDGGAWQATVHGITKSWTWLDDWPHIYLYSYTFIYLCA